MAITSAFQADDAGSIPAARSKSRADIAQLVERTLGKGEAGSSILPSSTIFLENGMSSVRPARRDAGAMRKPIVSARCIA